MRFPELTPQCDLTPPQAAPRFKTPERSRFAPALPWFECAAFVLMIWLTAGPG